MWEFNATRSGLALACALLAGSTTLSAMAREDAGGQARLQTLKKEIGAAYDEARRACGAGPAAGREACLAQARQTRDQDLKNAPSQVAASANMDSVTTTRTVTTGADSQTTTTTETPAAVSR